jgi:hypothetical protein
LAKNLRHFDLNYPLSLPADPHKRRAYLYRDRHHIITMGGRGTCIFAKGLLTSQGAATPPLPAELLQYADYAVWQRTPFDPTPGLPCGGRVVEGHSARTAATTRVTVQDKSGGGIDPQWNIAGEPWKQGVRRIGARSGILCGSRHLCAGSASPAARRDRRHYLTPQSVVLEHVRLLRQSDKLRRFDPDRTFREWLSSFAAVIAAEARRIPRGVVQ